jgi:superfamily I DNA/RNA helicase
VCYNRTLAPHIRRKIDIAFEQRNGRLPPPGTVDVFSENTLMYHLFTAGLWTYQTIDKASEIERAMNYLDQLGKARRKHPEKLHDLAYDAIYVDEGQDFDEAHFRLFKELCRTDAKGEPNLHVFYDDAQNLYGRGRPNWQSLGLNVRGGRSHVMSECFRNTRQVVEPSFNVLYGTCAAPNARVPSKEFGDLSALQEKKLVVCSDAYFHVNFAARTGAKPKLTVASNPQQELEYIVRRVRYLLKEQHVRPEDILLLTFRKDRVEQIAEALASADLGQPVEIHDALQSKDFALNQPGRLSVSTVASAKGYDAFYVIVASANDFPDDIKGRASFYVGCTRAIDRLEVYSSAKNGLIIEMEKALARAK